MRRIVVIGQTARANPHFTLDDLPGTTGRLDVMVRALGASLLVSHGVRRDTVLYLALLGEVSSPAIVRVDGPTVEYLRPDERNLAVRLRTALADLLDAESTGHPRGAFLSMRFGVAVARGGLDVLLADLPPARHYVLDETGDDVRAVPELTSPRGSSAPPGVEATFFFGDHRGFDPVHHARFAELGARAISLGPCSLQTDDAIAVLHNELDRGGA